MKMFLAFLVALLIAIIVGGKLLVDYVRRAGGVPIGYGSTAR